MIVGGIYPGAISAIGMDGDAAPKAVGSLIIPYRRAAHAAGGVVAVKKPPRLLGLNPVT